MKFDNDSELYAHIGQTIKYYRLNANLTQGQLADEAGISLSYLSKIEAVGCDKSISLSTLNQIANALSLEINTFFKKGNDIRSKQIM